MSRLELARCLSRAWLFPSGALPGGARLLREPSRHGILTRLPTALPAFLQQESVISKFLAVQAEPRPVLVSLARAWEARSFWDKEGKCLSVALAGLCGSGRWRYGHTLHHPHGREAAPGPDNPLNSRFMRGRWPGVGPRGRPAAPAWRRGRGCSARQFLEQVSGAGSAAARHCSQMAAAAAGTAQMAVQRGDAPSRAPPTPDPLELLAVPPSKCPKIREILLRPQPRPSVPRHPRRKFVAWHRGPGQVTARVPCLALRGCVCPKGCGSASPGRRDSVCAPCRGSRAWLAHAAPQNLPVATGEGTGGGLRPETMAVCAVSDEEDGEEGTLGVGEGGAGGVTEGRTLYGVTLAGTSALSPDQGGNHSVVGTRWDVM